ncbi:MAG TPA: DUF721 domain-containing protein [Pyrinomonadaceae bacterium]
MDDLFRAMPKLLRAAGESEEVFEAAACAAWRRVAGEGVRGLAVPFRLYRKTLVVAVTDATWQKQLEAISPQLIFRLNSLLGQAIVTYIEFRIDPQTVRRERARLRAQEGPAAAATTEAHEEHALQSAGVDLQRAAAAISDEALRRRFLVAAGLYIDAQENRK